MEEDIILENTEESGGEESLKTKLARLREELATCQAEKQTYLEGWQRSKADFVNARKNEELARKELIQYASSNVIRDMLDVIDTFELAFSHKEAWGKVDKNWRIGVESIYQKLQGALEQHGVKRIEPKTGTRFSPEIHQSVATTPVDSPEEDDTITGVVQSGYELYDRVLRPAKVRVGHYEATN